jgi:membrane-associated phospholipid phosphatase
VETVTDTDVTSASDGGRTPVPIDVAGSSAGDGSRSVRRRRHHPWIVPLSTTALFGLFTVAVHLRWLDDLDIAAYHAARPDGGWGLVQERATHVVSALQPAHFTALLLLLVAVLALLRRSLRPLGVAVVVAVPVVLVTFGTKHAMSLWDPSTTPVAHGSFPSGHTVVAVTAIGVMVLLVRPETRWGWLLPAVMGCVIGIPLVLASVHPATDVVGGGLLAAAALTSATAASLGQWASESRASQGAHPRHREDSRSE